MSIHASKRARVTDVAALKAKLPYITQAALAEVLKLAKKEQLPDGVASRHMLRRARDDFVHSMTPYGPIHQRLQLTGSMTIEVQHPMAMVHYCCKHSKVFSNLVQRIAQEFPPSLISQWNIILYCDEVSPGNQLAYKHERKTWAIYWSFAEFGSLLSNEDFYTHVYTHAHTRALYTNTRTHARTYAHTRAIYAHARALHTNTQTPTHIHTRHHTHAITHTRVPHMHAN